VLWRLGGRRSDFATGRGARFHWQHDARHLPGSLISVFDNGAGPERSESQSRGMVLHVDEYRRTTRLVRSYRHPRPILTPAMGSVQPLPDANVMVCWGLVPALSEFTSEGRLRGELRLPFGYNCYRGFRMPWAATPHDRPAIASVRGRSSGAVTVYASWNGATAVSAWQVSLGSSAHQLQAAGITPRTGFETAIRLTGAHGYVSVTALDVHGHALGVSVPVAI
jgi:hypothetical protein